MTKKEILELVKAGYTKEEIAAMEDDAEETEKVEESKDEKEEAAPAPEKEEKKEKEEKPDPKIDELLKAFKDLRNDLKKRSIVSDDYEIEDPRKKAEDILASIINPVNGNKK